jgi:hypothetical protein
MFREKSVSHFLTAISGDSKPRKSGSLPFSREFVRARAVALEKTYG